MRYYFLIFIMLFSITSYTQEKDSLLKSDINEIVEILEFMYEYDQILREYTIYKTFDKSETSRIENLSDSLLSIEKNNWQFQSDTLQRFIWRNYINPMDAIHTQYLIDLTEKYGFPSNKRIKKYYHKEFSNPEMNALLIFVHSPKYYWKEIELLITTEFNEGRIDCCTYGWIKWHVNGRNDMKYFLENGYKFIIDENGKEVLKAVDCD